MPRLSTPDTCNKDVHNSCHFNHHAPHRATLCQVPNSQKQLLKSYSLCVVKPTKPQILHILHSITYKLGTETFAWIQFRHCQDIGYSRCMSIQDSHVWNILITYNYKVGKALPCLRFIMFLAFTVEMQMQSLQYSTCLGLHTPSLKTLSNSCILCSSRRLI